ncbi:ABC transporter substrate-binding protein [Bacillaceae bacterium SIJ1]|uniref:MetQ/NlpA family ABC transporter substrate-binding protein n=1 Tax=Litoribacterium kuwaitense TaxID=1398745 RepID=UPI0013E9C628|nr:MetQ/NlpA family ABC transporter substrate-binding protein [Litoribacterium kuwaitense]NGP46333.1 ABC transporter substrate-binding protein [Litoribacterium kuwaitense]
MKKGFGLLLVSFLLLLMAACGGANGGAGSSSNNESDEKTNTSNEEASSEENVTLKVGASVTPHAEILEEAKPLLEEQGITLEIETFTDYVLPNQSLDMGELDANYFQHIPYLENQMKEFEYDFVNAGGIHIEPIGIYSQRHESLEDIPEGGVIIMSNSVSDHGRMLTLLESEGLITLAEGVEKSAATLDDIADNPKNFTFETDINPELVPKAYENDEADAFLINTNFAIDAGLNPQNDAITIEGSESPYVNIIAVRSEDEGNENIQKLVEALRSEEMQTYINEEYEGALVPVSE